MGNGVSTDQGNFPTHGIRDVRKAADRKQRDWSQLAKAPITKQPNSLIATANSYNNIDNNRSRPIIIKYEVARFHGRQHTTAHLCINTVCLQVTAFNAIAVIHPAAAAALVM